MNKKQIRLSEKGLNKVIKESVKKILTELDWRTYANAAKKRDMQIQNFGRDATDKGGNRLTHLRNSLDYAASDALTAKLQNNNANPNNNADIYTKNGYQRITTNNFDRQGRRSKGEYNYDNKGQENIYGNMPNTPMDDEVRAFASGKSKYIKGKGWSNESKLHRIIKESVKSVLNEIDYSQIPTGDFYERNKWYKDQVDNDFPNHGIKNRKDEKTLL